MPSRAERAFGLLRVDFNFLISSSFPPTRVNVRYQKSSAAIFPTAASAHVSPFRVIELGDSFGCQKSGSRFLFWPSTIEPLSLGAPICKIASLLTRRVAQEALRHVGLLREVHGDLLEGNETKIYGSGREATGQKFLFVQF
ncbi:hypothetical protein NPIL_477221 [Nephila pilipes]|uniref:Uncharacterized protein n=1 Tax=Nephila pilipes TaxID=299642 RepID=A0A8X6PTQ5_NEPPI|nr:hypothetical protein NPIL_477221 [Nephila pilipes]